MTLSQALLCQYDVTRCIYDFHAENEKNGEKLNALVFTERLRLKIEERLMFGMELDNLTFTLDPLSDPFMPKIQFSVYLSLKGSTIPVILHTLYQPKWLVD